MKLTGKVIVVTGALLGLDPKTKMAVTHDREPVDR